MCERRIKQIVNSSNFHTIIKESDKLKLKYMKDFGIHYAIYHWEKFIVNNEQIREIGLPLFQVTFFGNPVYSGVTKYF